MFNKKFPFYKQLDSTDCGPTCLKMISKYYGKELSHEYLRNITGLTKEGVSVLSITTAAEKIGLETLVANVDYDTLINEAPLPCIVYWRQRHFIIVYKIEKNIVYVADPDYGLIKYSKEDFIKGWTGNDFSTNGSNNGILILFEPTKTFFEKNFETDKEAESFTTNIISYLIPYKKYIYQIFIGFIIISFIQLSFPFLTQSVIDKGVYFGNIHFIVIVLIAQLILFITQSLVYVVQNWLLMYISSRINLNISNEFIQKLLRLPIRFFDSSSQGEILQKLQDTDRIEKYIMSFPMTIFSIFNLIIFSVILLYFNYIIFLTFFLFSIIYIVWIILFLKKRKEIEFKRFDQSSGNSSSLLQILNGIQEIKINGSENRRKNGWEEIRILSYKTSIKGNEIRQLQTIGSNVINELKNILISFISAYSVIKGDITLGMMMSIQYIIGQLNVPLLSFVQFISDNQDAKLSMKRIKEVESEIEEDSDTNDDIINIHNESIFVENVSFKYGNDKSNNVLEDINFVIPKGKVTAIVGESGSGKTTLVKLLLGMYDIQEGKILIGNYNLKNLNKKLWRKNCGVVMQNGYIFVDTIERNITESEQNIYISKDNLLKAVQMANIEEMIESLPIGYKTIIGPSGSSGVNISGGQAQRILIARALYKNPDYLILDEATSALDSNNEKIILESFQKLFNNKTVVVIAHRLSTVKNADNIIVLHRGKIVEQGNHEELLEKKGKYYNLVINQLQISN